MSYQDALCNWAVQGMRGDPPCPPEDLDTGEKARIAATALFMAGERPTVEKVRRALCGKGGQKTILDALSIWWSQTGLRFAELEAQPDIPPALRDGARELWRTALETAEARWHESRERHDQEMQAVRSELHQARELSVLRQEETDRLRGEIEREMHHRKCLEQECATLRGTTHMLRAQAAGLEQSMRAKESVHAASEVALRTEIEALNQKIDDLIESQKTAKERFERIEGILRAQLRKRRANISRLVRVCRSQKNRILNLEVETRRQIVAYQPFKKRIAR